jgi:GNAT superfamily N-acetyltransferase
VRSRLDVEIINDGFGGIVFKEEKVARPYKKYYGETAEPLTWMQFNTAHWVIFIVNEGDTPVGGITIACKTPELRMLNGRDDLADVWDIRVHPDFRHRGIGTKLFQKAIAWSRKNGYRQLCVETQNVNVNACHFYLKQGCKLGAINRFAYRGDPMLAEEVQLIWFMDL